MPPPTQRPLRTYQRQHELPLRSLDVPRVLKERELPVRARTLLVDRQEGGPLCLPVQGAPVVCPLHLVDRLPPPTLKLPDLVSPVTLPFAHDGSPGTRKSGPAVAAEWTEWTPRPNPELVSRGPRDVGTRGYVRPRGLLRTEDRETGGSDPG